MTVRDFLAEIDEYVKGVFSSEFTVNTIQTKSVPHHDDSSLTYENLDRRDKTCKQLETCVLFVDIRGSTLISGSHQVQTLAKLYSAFVSAMIKAGRYYGGHIRGIVGDRVMVVFNEANCYTNAVNTAILMNSISKHIINKRFKNNTIKCGIGIAHGKMLVTKTGVTRRGYETANYKSLVWLGKTANIASKLTDLAGKNESYEKPVVSVAVKNPFYGSQGIIAALGNSNEQWNWKEMELEDFFNSLDKKYHPSHIVYKDPNMESFFLSSKIVSQSTPAILMTKSVYLGFKKENPNDSSIKNGSWKKKNVHVPSCSEDIWGGDLIFTAVNQISSQSS